MSLLDQLPVPANMSDKQLADWLQTVSKVEEKRRYVWRRFARPDQLPPPGSWRVWLLLGGRGAGKTRTGSETMRGWAEEEPGQQMAIVAKTHREVLRICYEAPRAGLIRVVPPWQIEAYLRGSGSVELTLTNGTKMMAFSAQDPEAMRGYAFDKVWLDEFAAYPIQTAQTVYDMAWFCMRESADPKMVISTTPKPLPHVVKLLDRAKRRPDRVVVTRSRTVDNRKNLSPEALEELEEMYAGTRLGRQELDAELLEDVEGALWQLGWIERGRYQGTVDDLENDDEIELIRRCVAVDPADTVSETSDETGIVIAASDRSGDVYVLADRSEKTAGLAAAYRVWQAYIDYACEVVLIEGSSLWMMDVLQTAWTTLQADGVVGPGDPPVEVLDAWASKKARANPIAALYEKVPTPVHHVGPLGKLENQQTTWRPEDGGDSPDRLDALVYAVGWLRGMLPKQATAASPTTAGGVSRARRGRRGPGAVSRYGRG